MKSLSGRGHWKSWFATSLLLAGFAFADSDNRLNGPDTTVPKSWPQMNPSITSFAADVLDGWLYIYGGHAGEPHQYSTATTRGDFLRLDLGAPTAWQQLPRGPKTQGARMVVHDGMLYRIGGLQPRNEPDTDASLHSLTHVAAYRPGSRVWIPVQPMPAGRSSHEAVIVGDTIYVGGGWNMTGPSDGAEWHDSMFILDLSVPGATWTTVPQPFKRRALSAAVQDGKIYFMGGMDDSNDPSREVSVYDTVTGEWSSGPALPNGPMKGFGSAACTAGGRLVVSLYSGKLYALNPGGTGWVEAGNLEQRRFFHRLEPVDSGNLIAVGGASRRSGRVGELEWIRLSEWVNGPSTASDVER